MINVKIKHQIMAKSAINKICINKPKSILACIIDGIQNIVFYRIGNQKLDEMLTNSTRPLSLVHSISWSPNGNILALGSNKIQLWTFINNELKYSKFINEDFSQIQMIVWSADSTTYACCGVTKNNCITIRNIENNQLKNISIVNMVSSISFDPFGKYFFALYGNNKAIIYNNYTEVYRIIDLSNDIKNPATIKQTRSVDWSTDYSRIFTPSLEDQKISLAVSLLRNKQFQVNQIYTGHISPINCIKFNPKLYQYEKQVVQIFAMGDSAGYISLWRISKNKQSQSPLFLSKPHPKSDEVIQQIQWDSTGSMLIINTHKKYLILQKIDKKCFGRQLTELQTLDHLGNLYGASSATQLQQMQLQVFVSGIQRQQQPKNKIEPQLIKRIQQNNTQSNFSEKQSQKIKQFIKTQQKNTVINGKKRIIPSTVTEKRQDNNNNQIVIDNHISNGVKEIIYLQPLKLKPLQMREPLKNIYRLESNKSLHIKILNNQKSKLILLQILQSNQHIISNEQSQKTIINQRAFQNNIDYLNILRKFIIVINQKNLYIFDKQLNIAFLPMCVGQLHLFSINQVLDTYGISTDGTLRGYNINTKEKYVETNIGVLLEGQEQTDNPIQDIRIANDHKLYVRFKNVKKQYFLDFPSNMWIQMSFKDGKIQHGHSLKISKQENKQIENIFSLNRIKIQQNPQSLSQIEYNVVFYRKYNQNKILYRQNFINMIKQLKNRKLDNQLRNIINQHLFDANSELYISDIGDREKIWKGIQILGGSIIQQFALLFQ